MDYKHRDETCLSVLATSLQNSDCRIIMINDLRADACVLHWKCFAPSGQIRSMLGQIRSVSVRFGKLQDPFFSVYGHGSETLGDFKFPLKPKFLSRVSMLKPDARY